MNTAHTPGPWEDLTDARTIMVRTGSKSPRAMAIDCYRSGGSNSEDRSNARLISAAPDLLVALAELVAEQDARVPEQGHIFRDTGGMVLARDAIAKATGTA